MAVPSRLLLEILTTYLLLLTTDCDSAEVKAGYYVTGQSAGYFSSRTTLVSAIPPGTTEVKARSELECTAFCMRTTRCLRIYYDDTTDQCFLISSAFILTNGSSSTGRLLTAPDALVLSGRSCSNVNCSSDSVCIYDISTSFGGPMCIADNSQCLQDTHIINVNHYYTNEHWDDTDKGDVQTVTFYKTHSDTALRVQWYATNRAHCNVPGYCGRYYVTFNGTQCVNPSNIDFSNYDGSSNDHHQMSELDGLCYGLPAGIVTVSIVVGACPNFTVSDSHTGWQADRTMWVYELSMASSAAYSLCSALPIINSQYYSILGLDNDLDPDNLIMGMIYEKVKSDTVLRVKWQGTACVSLSHSSDYCGRWYITVNGSECTPKAEFVLGMFSNSYASAASNHKTRTLEGFCYGLAAGIYVVNLRVGSCYNATSKPNSYTGTFKSSSRMTVGEVRLATTVQAVTTADGRVIKVPFFNVQHWSWFFLNSDTDDGSVASVTYKKFSDTSGLHLRAVGSTRVATRGGCCRWYFKINGSECTSPGKIEGVLYQNYEANYHKPSVVDGVCYGLSSGSYIIDYNVGLCPNYTAADCYTGWGSTLHFIIDEVQLDSRITCISPLTCN